MLISPDPSVWGKVLGSDAATEELSPGGDSGHIYSSQIPEWLGRSFLSYLFNFKSKAIKGGFFFRTAKPWASHP